MTSQRTAAQKDKSRDRKAEGVEVIYYTDPLCCWSWVMTPAWKKIQKEFNSGLTVHYKMGGLLPSWDHFSDEVHSIRRPSQMGPEWMHAAHLSGVPTNSLIWITDPPASSFPACIAVKVVQLQSEYYVEHFLQSLRTAVMTEAKNIARNDVLLDAAWELRDKYSDFDLIRFKEDLMYDRGKEVFRKDLEETKYLGINRFPTLVIRRKDNTWVKLVGYQTYESLKIAIEGKPQ